MGENPAQGHGNRRSWDYPDCPECGSDVLVELNSSGRYAYCWGCSHRWQREDVDPDDGPDLDPVDPADGTPHRE